MMALSSLLKGAHVLESKQRPSILLYALGAVTALVGLCSALAGVWLAMLGGSLYYAVAGVLLLVIAYDLAFVRRDALILYAALLLGTILWALGEAGLDFWALAARGDILVPIGVVLALPWITRRMGTARWPGKAWPLVGSSWSSPPAATGRSAPNKETASLPMRFRGREIALPPVLLTSSDPETSHA